MAPHAVTPGEYKDSFLTDGTFANGAFTAGTFTNGTNGHDSAIGTDDANHGISSHGARSGENPNIIFIMADQMSAPLLKIYDQNSPIRTPNLEKLAETGVVFESAYCNSPLCAPSRFCLVAAQLPSKIGAYDNAADFPSGTPTLAHALRSENYETVLAGKMHFVGPDQLHGYENRLTTDIYPADFGWGANWDQPEERQSFYHNLLSIYQAGPTVVDNQLTYDDEVFYQSRRWLLEYVRQPSENKRPFFLTVSFTHPHDPYSISHKYWDMYEGVDIPLPNVDIAQDDQDPHSKRILKCIDLWGKTLLEDDIRRARRAYFGACSYVDDQIGGLLATLRDCRLADNTIVIFSGDHGDMLGERGLWYKMSWFEHSARVPLIVNYPNRFRPRRVKESVSTMDLGPTIADIINSDYFTNGELEFDGKSFYPALVGKTIRDEVFGEYMGESTVSPLLMIRRGRYKYVYCLDDPPQLFDLEKDPQELENLAESTEPKLAIVSANFRREVEQERWSNLKEIYKAALTSQRQRRRIYKAHQKGKALHWDFQPMTAASQQYIRSHMELDELEKRARFPPVDEYGRPLITAHSSGIAGGGRA